MKKITLLIVTFFLTQVSLATEVPHPAYLAAANPNDLSQKAQGEDMVIGDHLKIVPTHGHEQNDTLHYTVDAIYPQLEGTIDAAAKTFNENVLKMVDQQINQFKTDVARDKLHMLTLPKEIQHNYYKMDYDIDVIAPQNINIISLRLSTESMQAGRAHPSHFHKVLNFDLTHGKTLALSDLFKSHSAYLAAIAKYSHQQLSRTLQPTDQWMLAEGTKPSTKNYQNWNLEEDALLITFDEYQVAPYTYGAEEVEIPYSELKSLFSSKAVIKNEVSEKKVG